MGWPSQSRLPPCQLPQRGSQVGAPPKACAKPSLASPFGGGGLALARTERASCQPHRPLPWLSPLRARPPRSLVSLWLTPIKVKGKVAPFLKKRRPKKLYARFARPPPRTCAILSMSTSGSELPKARIESPGTGLSSRTPPRSSPRPPPRSGPGCAASVSAPPLSSRWPPRVSAPRPRGWPKAPAPRLPGRSPR